MLNKIKNLLLFSRRAFTDPFTDPFTDLFTDPLDGGLRLFQQAGDK